MTTISLPFPELLAVAATRGMLGLGAGLLLSDHLTRQQRQTAGWAFLAVGVLSTVPLGYDIFVRRRRLSSNGRAMQYEPVVGHA